MKNELFERFQTKWNETTELPPQTVGVFTPYYKMMTKRLKVMPIPLLIVCSLVIIITLFFIFGTGITFLTSVLQRGF